MAAVVTGASGFLGRALVATLLHAGQSVVAIDRRPAPPEQTLRPGLAVVRSDVAGDDPVVRAALADADIVYHLAARPGVRDDAPGIAVVRTRDNVIAAARVLQATPPDVPVLVTSSSSVYGGSDGRPSVESGPVRPRGGYAASKVGTELLCARRAAAGGHVLVVRPFTLVGEHQRPDMALARWIEAARVGRPLPVYGSLRRTRDLVDVREAARALLALGRSGATGVVNLGTGRAVTLAEMLDAVAAVLRVRLHPQLRPAATCEVADTLADVEHLHRIGGVVLSTNLLEVVARQVAAATSAVALPRPAAPVAHVRSAPVAYA